MQREGVECKNPIRKVVVGVQEAAQVFLGLVPLFAGSHWTISTFPRSQGLAIVWGPSWHASTFSVHLSRFVFWSGWCVSCVISIRRCTTPSLLVHLDSFASPWPICIPRTLRHFPGDFCGFPLVCGLARLRHRTPPLVSFIQQSFPWLPLSSLDITTVHHHHRHPPTFFSRFIGIYFATWTCAFAL